MKGRKISLKKKEGDDTKGREEVDKRGERKIVEGKRHAKTHDST